MTTDELRERVAYVEEYEYRQPPQSARDHAMALATAKAHWKQIAHEAIAALTERDREVARLREQAERLAEASKCALGALRTIEGHYLSNAAATYLREALADYRNANERLRRYSVSSWEREGTPDENVCLDEDVVDLKRRHKEAMGFVRAFRRECDAYRGDEA